MNTSNSATPQWNERSNANGNLRGDTESMFHSDRKKADEEIRQLNASLEKRVAERTSELVQANDQLKGEITERRRQEKIQQATYQISEAVHTADDLPSFYARVHAIVKTLMPARNFYIALLDASKETISFPYFVDE